MHGDEGRVACRLYSALGVVTLLGTSTLVPERADGPKDNPSQWRPVLPRLVRLVMIWRRHKQL
jgi:hypothetical protein